MEKKDTFSSSSKSEETPNAIIQDKSRRKLHDLETFTGTMFGHGSTQKQLAHEDISEIGSKLLLKYPDTVQINGQNQKSRIQAADQGMMHMLMMQILRPIYDEEPMAEVANDVMIFYKHQSLETVGQPLKNQSVVRQPTAFKSERPRILKPRFASQVDVNNDLSKPVTTHHLPKRRESAPAKPHHMIAQLSSNSQTVCLDGFQPERHLPLAQPKVESEPPNGSNADIPNQCESEQALNVSAVQASVVNEWRLLKITLQAPFLNVQKTFDRSNAAEQQRASLLRMICGGGEWEVDGARASADLAVVSQWHNQQVLLIILIGYSSGSAQELSLVQMICRVGETAAGRGCFSAGSTSSSRVT
ncbi:hypothetical protein Tco_1221370 [Tanacetum coccineum]